MPRTVTNIAPQFLHAYQINVVGPADAKTSSRQLILSGGVHVVMSIQQLQQYTPVVGDYYVIPSEGHPYATPKSTFLQSYTVGS